MIKYNDMLIPKQPVSAMLFTFSIPVSLYFRCFQLEIAQDWTFKTQFRVSFCPFVTNSIICVYFDPTYLYFSTLL